MRYECHSRKTIRAIDPAEPHVIISISHDDDKTRPKLRPNANCLAVLYLTFNDVDHAHQPKHIIPFNTQMAREVVQFWQAWHDKAQTCYVHCDAGQCRSPGVAAALQRLETGDDQEWFDTRRPNRFVYRQILDYAYPRNLHLA